MLWYYATVQAALQVVESPAVLLGKHLASPLLLVFAFKVKVSSCCLQRVCAQH
jgi:hypothetical protein